MRILTADAAQSLVAATLGAIGLTYACSAPPSGGDQRRHAPLANDARSAAGGIIEEALTAEELRQRCVSAGVSEEALDAAFAGSAPKRALVELLLQQAPDSQRSSATARRKGR